MTKNKSTNDTSPVQRLSDMRKITGLILLMICFGLISCGHKVDKEAMLKKVKEHPTELTQQDYSDILTILDEEIDKNMKIVEDNKTSLVDIAMITENNSDIQTMAERLGIAYQVGFLTPEQVKRLETVMAKSQQLVNKAKIKIYEFK